LFPYVKYVFYI